MTAVHQVLSSAGPYDAVSVQARLWRALLTERGYGGADHAAAVDPRARGDFAPLERLRPARGDLLVIRWSAYSPRLLALLERPERKLLVYHNVTPPGYFWNHHAGRGGGLRGGPRAAAAVRPRGRRVRGATRSTTPRDLRAAGADARVLPILFDPARLAERGRAPEGDGAAGAGGQPPGARTSATTWRSPRSRPGGPSTAARARMLCVGEPLSPSYAALIGGLANGSVTLAGGLSQPDLNSAYAAADVMLSMSEHEGFSVPLLEAFHFGLPVVARPAGAMPEVGGDAVLWDRADDLAVTAELIDAAVNDDALRADAGRARPGAAGRVRARADGGADRDGDRGARLAVSEEYDPDNLLDRNTPQATMEVHYEQVRRREADILAARLPLTGGDVLSVGCGWNPGRHMFPSPAWRMTGVELEPDQAGGAGGRRHPGRRLRRPGGRAGPGARLLRRGALPARAAPHRLPGPAGAGVRRGRARCCAPGAR